MVSHRKWLKEQRLEGLQRARDTWNDEAYGLAMKATRGGRMRLTWDIDPERFVALMAVHQLREGLLVQLERELVVEVRREGVPWDEIGFALGVTGEAARKRHAEADVAARASVGPR